jgi:predicted SAM-dependent methyltransferase
MPSSEIKLNIGCGLSGIPGWHNLDNSPSILLSRIPVLRTIFKAPPWPKDVRRYDVRKGLPFPPNSVKYIYLSHSFHQFTRDESLALAKDCREVLEPGGIMRVVVPDLERCAREYLADPDPLASEKFLKRISLHHSWRDLLHPGSSVTQMFDTRSLVHMLRAADFDHVESRSFGISAIPEIDQIELAVRRRESIYVEARKMRRGF